MENTVGLDLKYREVVVPSCCRLDRTATAPAQYAYELVNVQQARPVGLLVVVPMTFCSCRDTFDECGFRGDLGPDLEAGEPVGVVRAEGVCPLSRLRKLYWCAAILYIAHATDSVSVAEEFLSQMFCEH